MMPTSPIPKKIRQREYAKRWIEKNKANPEWRAARVNIARKWSAVNKEKRYAHNVVNDDLRDGRMVKQPCEVCQELKVHAHHDDYSKPRDVRWLCISHHEEVHHGKTV